MAEIDGKRLIAIARAAIESELEVCDPPLLEEDWLKERAATFVTLYTHGVLRGCVGTLEPNRALGHDVAHNAIAAAFYDTRFPTFTRGELPNLEIEVSILSAMEEMPWRTEVETLQNVRPNIDGLVFDVGGRRSTFLPQVWEKLPNPKEFLRQLKLKGGFSPEFWSSEVRIFRYTLQKWREKDLK